MADGPSLVACNSNWFEANCGNAFGSIIRYPSGLGSGLIEASSGLAEAHGAIGLIASSLWQRLSPYRCKHCKGKNIVDALTPHDVSLGESVRHQWHFQRRRASSSHIRKGALDLANKTGKLRILYVDLPSPGISIRPFRVRILTLTPHSDTHSYLTHFLLNHYETSYMSSRSLRELNPTIFLDGKCTQ
jgi:hypothetical protein